MLFASKISKNFSWCSSDVLKSTKKKKFISENYHIFQILSEIFRAVQLGHKSTVEMAQQSNIGVVHKGHKLSRCACETSSATLFFMSTPCGQSVEPTHRLAELLPVRARWLPLPLSEWSLLQLSVSQSDHGVSYTLPLESGWNFWRVHAILKT